MHDASVGPARSQSIVDGLTLTEKAALLSGKNFWQTRGYPHLGLPSLSLADGSHGVRKQLGSADHLGLSESEKATSFPTMATLANSWDVMLVEEVGAAVGLEAAALGVDVLLGPGLNIKRTPLGGRNFEYLSEDPYLTGKLAAGHVRGVQSRGVAATPKHFVANSQELRRMVVSSVVDERTLREIYLTAFEIVVHEATPRVIMSSYNPVNGVYTNEHPHLLARLLRGEWGFEGAVVTDWGGSNSTVEAVRQGSSLEMPSPGLDSVRQLVAAVECGNLDEEILDARVREVVELALASHSVSELVESWDVDAHHVLARRAAESSIVLLKNTDRVLPLPAKSRVGVIGDFAAHPRDQGAGSSVVNPTKVVTPLDALAVSPIDVVGFAQGFLRDGNPDEGLAQQAENLADDCDVVLVYLGLAEASETEGRDRRQLSLAQNQIDLLARLRTRSARIVVVLSAGSVVEIPWLGNCDALVHGYLGGQAGAEAVINVLTGEVNPSGKLAETYPIRLEDMPAFGYFPGLEKTAEYREGIFVGYRYYETADVPVRFPFGFGLSYTEFKYTNLIVDENSASFTITNTGLVAGAEIAQLYVGGTTGGTFRAAKELKGFAKVHLGPGESSQVRIALDDKAFRFFDIESGSWQIEKGNYTVMVGASVADIRQESTLAINGTIAPQPIPELLRGYSRGDVTSVTDEQFAALLGHPVPETTWTPGPLSINDPLCRMHVARNPLARLAYRVLDYKRRETLSKRMPDLGIYFVYNMPFRSIAKLTGGAVSMEMVDDIVAIVNGYLVRGSVRLIRSALRNVRANAKTRAALGRAV